MEFCEEQFGKTNVRYHQDHGILVNYDSFCEQLKVGSRPTDSTQYRRDNLTAKLKKYDVLIPGENDKGLWLKLRGLLRYIFQHSEHNAVCANLADSVETALAKTKACGKPSQKVPSTGVPSSILELYQLVGKNPLRNKILDSFYIEQYNLDDEPLPTLYNCHKLDIKDEIEWKRIMFFELHFAKHCGDEPLEDVDEVLKRKFAFYKLLMQSATLGKEMSQINEKVIDTRAKRKKMAQSNADIQYKGTQAHNYSILDKDLLSHVKRSFPDVHCMGVVPTSRTDCVDVCLTGEPHIVSQKDDIAHIVYGHLARKHGLDCENIHIFNPDVLSGYYKEDLDSFARFTLADDISLERIRPEISHTNDNLEDIDKPQCERKCQTCFPSSDLSPLEINSFSLFDEWLKDVPFIVQLVLESSISNANLRKAKDKQEYLKPKLTKLYASYDVMLHILNKCHLGVLQETNSLELMMHSKSLTSVFKVANLSGMAMSRSAAFESLDRRLVDDDLYYNTYLKEYPIMCTKDGIKMLTNVSLRQCVPIVMLDNLVRLKYRDDPQPGDNRSKQMNTLPITLQGLPVDSDEVQSWHHDNCDTPFSSVIDCECMKCEVFPHDDLLALAVTLLPEEDIAAKKFSRLCTFGIPDLPSMLFQGGFLEKISSSTPTNMDTTHTGACSSDTLGPSVMPHPQTPCSSTLDFSHEDVNPDTPHAHQKTPIRFRRTERNPRVSTPVRTNEALRPLTFNTMSPLKSTMVIPVDADENEEGEPRDSAHTDDTPEMSEEMSVAQILGSAIRDGYNLTEFDQYECTAFDNAIDDGSPTIDTVRVNQSSSDSHDEEHTHALPLTLPFKFGFTKYICPDLLTRHPPPATGKDDDPDKLQEILDDLLIKLGHEQGDIKGNILFGPDHKIGKNLLMLRRRNKKYKVFLPEFPLLHVRKHKITILFTAYKNVGLVELVRYMKKDDEEDWAKLINVQHIDQATLLIRRLSVALHIAFLVSFSRQLPDGERAAFLSSLEHEDQVETSSAWGEKFEQFITAGCQQNATFCLHWEMLKHIDDVIAVHLAERLGGKDGYNLLLSALKSSLVFSFLNGAASYAPYTLQLLILHYESSHFAKQMKMALFSTPRPGSVVNLSGDTKREMDHLDVLKRFRAGSTVASVTKRMSLVDEFSDVHSHFNSGHGKTSQAADKLGWTLETTDWKHILPTAAVILRRGGICTDPCEVPQNVYVKEPTDLDPILLDCISAPAGIFLLQKSACNLRLIGLSPDDIIQPGTPGHQSALVKKIAKRKSTTIHRSTLKTVLVPLNKSSEEIHEEQRIKQIAGEMKHKERMTSRMNMCQALVNHDCTKPKITKSATVPSALKELVSWAEKELNSDRGPLIVMEKPLSLLLPPVVKKTASSIIVEFAGVKYKLKGNIVNGKQYLEYAQSIMERYLKQFPSVKSIIICEEKYEFTPDALKGPTRQQRTSRASANIGHLHEDEEIISENVFSRAAALGSTEGKATVSTFLARKPSLLTIKKDLELIIDSQFILLGCCCDSSPCEPNCKRYAVPRKCKFEVTGHNSIGDMLDIQQRKGEAEMSQIDWLIESSQHLNKGQCVVSMVTSGDIDTVSLHLLAVSMQWPRDDKGLFLNPVYVILQKKGDNYDFYAITDIIELLEKATKDKNIGVKAAVALTIGGNDFLPRYREYGTHSKVLRLVTHESYFSRNLLSFSPGGFKLNEDVYVNLVKCLYSQDINTPFEQAHLNTILNKKTIRPIEKWMPPLSCIKQMAGLTAVVLEYMLTAGQHDAFLPESDKLKCLQCDSRGQIMYDFGQDAFKPNVEEWCKSLVQPKRKSLTRKRLYEEI